MQPHRFGETAGLSHAALQPGPERAVVPFNLLRLYFAHGMLFWIEGAIVHVCTIGRDMVQAPWCQQCFSRSEDFIRIYPQDRREDYASSMINGMPEPSWLACLRNDTPPLIDLRFCHWLDLNTALARIQVLDCQIVAVLELRRLFLPPPSREWDCWAGPGPCHECHGPSRSSQAFAV
jgi:hypothetical protein